MPPTFLWRIILKVRIPQKNTNALLFDYTNILFVECFATFSPVFDNIAKALNSVYIFLYLCDFEKKQF